ncbi:hypothetical protein TNCV_347461 [Trichonephila clavipes]|nr:hypothetical protein TNCV_347461 [Trichonephila clavipes]
MWLVSLTAMPLALSLNPGEGMDQSDCLAPATPTQNGGINVLGFQLGLLNETQVFLPLMPQYVAELHDRIPRVVNNRDSTMLTRVRQKLDYRIDVCHVTKGSHTEYQ